MKRGLFRRLYEGVIDTAMRKQVVGIDKAGNTYMRWTEQVGGQQVERREVRWAQPYIFYDPNQVPPPWRMWLKKQRDTPPTEEEVASNAADAAALKSKVKALEEAEHLRRLRQATHASHATKPGSSPPDVSRLLQQMEKEGQAPSGQGETFQPGTWKPGQ